MEENCIKKKSWANQNDEWIVEMEVGTFANGRWNYKTKTFIVDTGQRGKVVSLLAPLPPGYIYVLPKL